MTPQPGKFLFTYDKAIDRDIHEVIEGTLSKRRSNRLRELIRAGLRWEEAGMTGVVLPEFANEGGSVGASVQATVAKTSGRPPVPRFGVDRP